MKIVPDNAQHIGARKEQQDAFGFSDLERTSATRRGGALSVVADGMGGLEQGQEMSRLACRTMIEAYAGKAADESVPEVLDRALHEANGRVLARARQLGVRGETGTTLSAAVVHGDGLYWISVGDSRIYLHRDGMLTQLTVDHGYARHLDRQAAAGEISPQAAAEHPERHAITSFLGLESLEEIDRAVRPFPLQPGDRILLCTDGLHGSLSDDEIRAILDAHTTGAAQALVDAALAKRSRNQDNVTATLFDYFPNGAPVRGTTRITALPATVFGRTSRAVRGRRVLLVALLMALAVGAAGAIKWRNSGSSVGALAERTAGALAPVWKWLPIPAPGAGGGSDSLPEDADESPEPAPAPADEPPGPPVEDELDATEAREPLPAPVDEEPGPPAEDEADATEARELAPAPAPDHDALPEAEPPAQPQREEPVPGGTTVPEELFSFSSYEQMRSLGRRIDRMLASTTGVSAVLHPRWTRHGVEEGI